MIWSVIPMGIDLKFSYINSEFRIMSGEGILNLQFIRFMICYNFEDVSILDLSILITYI